MRLGMEETQKTVSKSFVQSQNQFCYVKVCVYASRCHFDFD